MDGGGTTDGGVDTSTAKSFTITVTAVNDAPSYTAGANQTVLGRCRAADRGRMGDQHQRRGRRMSPARP